MRIFQSEIGITGEVPGFNTFIIAHSAKIYKHYFKKYEILCNFHKSLGFSETLDFEGKIWYNTRKKQKREQRKEQKNADQYSE